MKCVINSKMQYLRGFVGSLPEVFEVSGEVLHDGRNKIKAYDIGGERFVVKRYKRPNKFNVIMYSFFRKSKARRAYEHAERLLAMGFDTPEPVAWCECRRRGVISETYFVSRWSGMPSLAETTANFPDPDTLPVLDAFAVYCARLHEAGVNHKDFNRTNILWEYDAGREEYKFQLIDINRMSFHGTALSAKQSMVSFRRLSCPAIAYIYVLNKYARARGWDANDTILTGTFFRLLFRRRQQHKEQFKEYKSILTAKRACR